MRESWSIDRKKRSYEYRRVNLWAGLGAEIPCNENRSVSDLAHHVVVGVWLGSRQQREFLSEHSTPADQLARVSDGLSAEEGRLYAR